MRCIACARRDQDYRKSQANRDIDSVGSAASPFPERIRFPMRVKLIPRGGIGNAIRCDPSAFRAAVGGGAKVVATCRALTVAPAAPCPTPVVQHERRKCEEDQHQEPRGQAALEGARSWALLVAELQPVPAEAQR